MRYTPSLSAIIFMLVITAALAANFLIINPAYNYALANHRTLKAQLNAAQQQQARPLSDDQVKLAKRLQTPNDAKLLIDALTQARNAVRLGDIAYSISPPIPQNDFLTQRIDLTITTATDSTVWPFLQMVEDNAAPLLRVDEVHITRTVEGVQATATFINYRWAE